VQVDLNKEKVTSEELIEQWLKENEVTQCKDFKPSGKKYQRGAKDKNFVTDRAMQSGYGKRGGGDPADLI